jgi:phosphoribosylaminoimidazole-succinocarboxamide synthase
MRQSHIADIPLFKRGKVRDVYDLDDSLLIVATDRISCFDVVLPTPIPGKGQVLTQMSGFWFEKTRTIIDNHCQTLDVPSVVADAEVRESLEGRTMVVRKAIPLPV